MTKKTIQLFAAASATLCFAASAVGQDVIAGWNFNDVSDSPNSQFAPSFGSGTLTTNWIFPATTDFVGSSINLMDGDVAGRDLGFANTTVTDGVSVNEGNWLQFQINTVGFTDLVMSYAGRTTGTGMRSLTWSYSTDGISFTNFETVDHVDAFGSGNYGLVTIDFSSVAAASGAATFFVRGTFSVLDGQSALTNVGNTRFDNVQFQAIPEPSTYAAIVGVLFFGLVLYRRRAR